MLITPALAATTTKKFTADVTPHCVERGSLDTELQVKLTNKAKQQLGSANLTAPVGFTLDAGFANTVTPSGRATVNGNVLEIRDLSLPSNTTATVTFHATTPSAAGAYTWSIAGKQANDFSGSPGNDFLLDALNSDLVTFVSCRLRVVSGRGPADAEKLANITSQRFNPSGLAIQIEVLQPRTDMNIRVTSSSDEITLRLNPNALQPGADLSPTAPSLPAVAGVATFSSIAIGQDLTIDESGIYTLHGDNVKMIPTDTGPFAVYDDVSDCRRHQDCPTVSASNGTTGVSVRALASNTDGFAFAAMDAEATIDCAGYEEVSGTATFGASLDRDKIVVLTIDKSLAPSRGTGQYQFCYSSEFLGFTDRSGNGILPGGAGLLADCAPSIPSPCLDGRQGGATTITLTARVPAGATRGKG